MVRPGSVERSQDGASRGTHAASSNAGWPGSGEDRLDTRYFNRANSVLSRDQPDRLGLRLGLVGEARKNGGRLTPAGAGRAWFEFSGIVSVATYVNGCPSVCPGVHARSSGPTISHFAGAWVNTVTFWKYFLDSDCLMSFHDSWHQATDPARATLCAPSVEEGEALEAASRTCSM